MSFDGGGGVFGTCFSDFTTVLGGVLGGGVLGGVPGTASHDFNVRLALSNSSLVGVLIVLYNACQKNGPARFVVASPVCVFAASNRLYERLDRSRNRRFGRCLVLHVVKRLADGHDNHLKLTGVVRRRFKQCSDLQINCE